MVVVRKVLNYCLFNGRKKNRLPPDHCRGLQPLVDEGIVGFHLDGTNDGRLPLDIRHATTEVSARR